VGQADAARDDDERDTVTRDGLLPPAKVWPLYIALFAITAVVVLQKTKHALLPATQTRVLFLAEGAAICGALVLRSGWFRDNEWRREQLRLGTIANNYYEPRRESLINGFAVGVGVLLALWWGLATWSVVLSGVRRGVITRGLLDFEVATVVGALTGAIVGAVTGLIVGHGWESRHRRKRVLRKAAHA
jgi:hypothetical protein